MKPSVSPVLLRYALMTLGLTAVGVSSLSAFTWQGCLAVFGGACLGVLKLGPDQYKLSELPAELQAILRPPSGSK